MYRRIPNFIKLMKIDNSKTKAEDLRSAVVAKNGNRQTARKVEQAARPTPP